MAPCGACRRVMGWLLVVTVLAVGAAPVFAQQRQEAAKAAFYAGKTAYEAGDYATALNHFQRSYTLGEEPALLYNIAASLQSLNRPGEAAATLREFIKLRPDDPERGALEARIANLDRAQQIIDREHAREQAQRQEEEAKRRAVEGQVARGALVSQADVQAQLEATRRDEKRKRKRTLGIALGVTFGALAVGGAVALGVLLSRSDEKDYDFGKVTVTR